MGKSHKELNKKLIHYTGIFSKIRHCLPMTCCKTVCNSRFNYGSEIYVNTTKKYIQPLMVTQNKLLRILQFKHNRTPSRNPYRQFNTLKPKDLHYFNICCIVQKFIHLPNLLPEAINGCLYTAENIQKLSPKYPIG